MNLIYPNIVPENNLRLPDALTVRHGPARLLGRFILEADKAARAAGLRLRLRHDFDELHRINQQQVMSSGAAWVRPDYRRRGLSQLLPRIAKAYAVSRWPIDWTFGFVTRVLVEKGVASSSYGTGRYSYSVWFPDLPFGELVVAYTEVQEVYDDLAKYLTTDLSGSRDWKLASASASAAVPSGIAQELTKISSDGVFHGSINRS